MHIAPSQGRRGQSALLSPDGSLSPKDCRPLETPPSPQHAGGSNEVCGMGALASP